MGKSSVVDGVKLADFLKNLQGNRQAITHSCCGMMGKALIFSHCAAQTSPCGYEGIKALVLLSVK